MKRKDSEGSGGRMQEVINAGKEDMKMVDGTEEDAEDSVRWE